MNSSAVIIANPAARNSSKQGLEAAARIMRNRGLDVEILYTQKRGDAERLARDEAKKSPKFIAAAGGDGTYNEVATGLSGTGVPMAILPMGTVNVLALELGIPFDPAKAAKLAVSANANEVTLGRITLGGGESRNFCLMTGIGYDAYTVVGIIPWLKKLTGKAAYVANGFRTLMRWNPDELDIELDGVSMKGYSLIASNAAKYAGELSVCKDATMTEPMLNVFVMHKKSRFMMAKYILGILTGLHLGMPGITYQQAKSIKVDGRAFVQVDGDFIGHSPCEISIIPRGLKIIY